MGGTSVLRTEGFTALKRGVYIATAAARKTSTAGPGFFHKKCNLRRVACRRFATGPSGSSSYSRSSAFPVVVAVATTASAFVVGKMMWENKVHADDQNAPKKEGEGGMFDWFWNLVGGSASSLFNAASDAPLLPDPDPPPYTKPYTIVIADDALLARSYSLKEGMATKKRPGVEYFLATLSALGYEIVLFSLQGSMTYGQIIEKLDPNHHALHRLFVDATVLNASGKQIKDLNRLNRNLMKVLAIDVDSEGVTPVENLIIISKYDGKASDTTLLDMLPFFKLIAHGKHEGDLRAWVKRWNTNDPQYFKNILEDAVRKLREKEQAPAGTQEPEEGSTTFRRRGRPF